MIYLFNETTCFISYENFNSLYFNANGKFDPLNFPHPGLYQRLPWRILHLQLSSRRRNLFLLYGDSIGQTRTHEGLQLHGQSHLNMLICISKWIYINGSLLLVYRVRTARMSPWNTRPVHLCLRRQQDWEPDCRKLLVIVFPSAHFHFFHIFHLIFLKNLLSTEIRSSPSSGSDIDYYDENADASYSFDFEADGYNRLVIIV